MTVSLTQAAIEKNRITLAALIIVALAGLSAYATMPRSELDDPLNIARYGSGHRHGDCIRWVAFDFLQRQIQFFGRAHEERRRLDAKCRAGNLRLFYVQRHAGIVRF